jgi:hypothetical protein
MFFIIYRYTFQLCSSKSSFCGTIPIILNYEHIPAFLDCKMRCFCICSKLFRNNHAGPVEHSGIDPENQWQVLFTQSLHTCSHTRLRRFRSGQGSTWIWTWTSSRLYSSPWTLQEPLDTLQQPLQR